MYAFNGTHYIYENTLCEDVDAVIQHIDVNDTYAIVCVRVNSTKLEVIELTVNKIDNNAIIKRHYIEFNPFYIFYPVDPSDSYLETTFLNTSVKIKYIRKFTYSRFIRRKIPLALRDMKYLFECIQRKNDENLRTYVPVSFRYANNTTQVVYGEANICILEKKSSKLSFLL